MDMDTMELIGFVKARVRAIARVTARVRASTVGLISTHVPLDSI